MFVSLEEALAGEKSTKGGVDVGRNLPEVCCGRATFAVADLRLALCRLEPLQRGCRFSFALPCLSFSSPCREFHVTWLNKNLCWIF